MEPRRRLPLLQPAAPPDGADGPPRAPWQWVCFGVLAIFAVWLPLSSVATLLALRLGGMDDAPVLRALLFAAGLALAALAGGYLVGRWGTHGVGVREAALAGLAAALAAAALAWIAAGPSAGALATLVLAVPPAALGGRLGLRRRAGP